MSQLPHNHHPTAHPFVLFEISWEVCNKVGGIYTVVSSKAPTLVDLFGDDYVTVGPWLLSRSEQEERFEPEPGHDDFVAACRQAGVPVRVGRWLIPGRPRALLVEFSGLLADKDPYLTRLWERYHVDSLAGAWDYLEPVLFGRAAGIAIERWWRLRLQPTRRAAVAHAHEWMAATALLHLHQQVPEIATVFTTHATVLGRALASTGHDPAAGLVGQSPEQAAREGGVAAKHSLEGVAARESDVFTTVSGVTAQEAELFHRRRASPILPNGIDLAVIDRLAAEHPRDRARAALLDLASRFLGSPPPADVVLVGTSGRYEFHNKGFDVLLEALARLDSRPGKPVIAFFLVPAGASGPRLEMLAPALSSNGGRDPSVVSTHRLFDPDGDPIQRACARLGLANAGGSRVKVLHLPIYLSERDGLLDMPYEAVLRALDLACFPSFYEPWGLTPAESLGVGVPTVTTDSAGFGRWMQHEGLGEDDGLYVLLRHGRGAAQAVADLDTLLEAFLSPPQRPDLAQACRAAAGRLAWADLVPRYLEAFDLAMEVAAQHPRLATADADRATRLEPGPQLVSQAAAPPPLLRLHTFEVGGSLPPAFEGLMELSRNYRWTWDPEARELFEQLSPRHFRGAEGNPVRMLRDMPRAAIEVRPDDADFAHRVERVVTRHRAEAALPVDPAWAAAGLDQDQPVAYFCFEFGIESDLSVYGGGLGVLAGDHVKTASDLGLPLVAVGCLFRRGYLRQRVTRDGDQQGLAVENDPAEHALELVLNPEGEPLLVELGLPGGPIVVAAWRAKVGRVQLYLLDTDMPQNRPEARAITHQLYGGDSDLRLRQEIVLGRAGMRLLHQLGIEPAVLHLNEGHAAFAPLERAATLVRQRGLTFDEAREVVRASTVFTTHTAVPAGHDRFGESLLRRYFSDVESWLGLPWERFFALGADGEPSFSMTRLAVQLAAFVNGVSEVHGRVSRELLRDCWPSLLPSEVPVAHITNGVHAPSWVAPEIARIGASPALAAGNGKGAAGAGVSDRDLWRAREALRQRLLEETRRRLRRSSADRDDPPELLQRLLAGLDEEALLVGFARRFAPYKRADLLLRQPKRLREILERQERPIRILFAGKAHPSDGHGQEILRQLVRASLGEELGGLVFFLEDYNLELGRLLVQGVDLWLNTPIPPLEASGTSGMKAAMNGALNLSVLDGWWAEGYDGNNGWAIGADEKADGPEAADDLDSDATLRLLDREIAPLFFERDDDGVPRRWLEKVRHSIGTLSRQFDTRRMLQQYRDMAYVPAALASVELRENGFRGARETVWRNRSLRRGFAGLRIAKTTLPDTGHFDLGDELGSTGRSQLFRSSSASVRWGR
jgi:glycogen phosphorylase/synthase